MKPSHTIYFLIIGLVLVCVCRDSNSDQKFFQQRIELGASTSYFDYKEPGLMREKGPFVGVNTAFTYRGPLGKMEHVMFRAEAHGAYGRVNYDGSLMNGTPYKIGGIDDMMFEGRIILGRDCKHVIENLTITPYTGIAYRHLTDNAEEDPAGYNRASNYWYTPLGVEISPARILGFHITGRIEYDLFIRGRQKSAGVLRNTQKNGYGSRGILRIRKKAGRFDYVLEPFITYWEIDQSDYVYLIGGRVWEPYNHQVEYGIRAAVVINIL